MGRRRWATAVLVLLVIVLAAGAAIAGYAITAAARNSPAATQAPRAAGTPGASGNAALSALASPPTPPSVSRSRTTLASSVAAQLRSPASSPGLGSVLRARVADLRSGAVLFDRGGDDLATPASTAKLLTAAALLSVRASTDRITTTVRLGRGGAIVLVGSGDPTLSAARPGRPARYPDAARLADLAAAVRRARVTPTRIVVDDRLFAGPAVSSSWAPGDVPTEYASAITAVMTDGGRAAPGAAGRSAAPDLAAGRELAAALGRPRLPVARGAAPVGARLLGAVRSAPFSVLIEQMLQQSDNVIAECLGRQAAIAQRQPASFVGAATAIRSVLRRARLDVGRGMRDASGLAVADRLSAATLVAVLRLAAATPRLRDVLAALPVAGWTGTLAGRYLTGASARGAGVVRAKTGTLSGVSALAGVVRDRDGATLVFAFVADRAGSTVTAQAALDRLAGTLAGCGCSS